MSFRSCKCRVHRKFPDFHLTFLRLSLTTVETKASTATTRIGSRKFLDAKPPLRLKKSRPASAAIHCHRFSRRMLTRSATQRAKSPTISAAKIRALWRTTIFLTLQASLISSKPRHSWRRPSTTLHGWVAEKFVKIWNKFYFWFAGYRQSCWWLQQGYSRAG